MKKPGNGIPQPANSPGTSLNLLTRATLINLGGFSEEICREVEAVTQAVDAGTVHRNTRAALVNRLQEEIPYMMRELRRALDGLKGLVEALKDELEEEADGSIERGRPSKGVRAA